MFSKKTTTWLVLALAFLFSLVPSNFVDATPQPYQIYQGGTGATTSAQARINLGIGPSPSGTTNGIGFFYPDNQTVTATTGLQFVNGNISLGSNFANGISNPSPLYNLEIENTVSPTSGISAGLFENEYFLPGASNLSNLGAFIRGRVSATSSYPVSQEGGLQVRGQNDGAQPVTQLVGIVGDASNNGAGNVTEADGTWYRLFLSGSGNITNGVETLFTPPFITGSGHIGNLYGIYANDLAGYATNTADFILYNHAGFPFEITANGAVGIGTSSTPNYSLEDYGTLGVHSTSTFLATSTYADGAGIQFGPSDVSYPSGHLTIKSNGVDAILQAPFGAGAYLSNDGGGRAQYGNGALWNVAQTFTDAGGQAFNDASYILYTNPTQDDLSGESVGGSVNTLAINDQSPTGAHLAANYYGSANGLVVTGASNGTIIDHLTGVYNTVTVGGGTTTLAAASQAIITASGFNPGGNIISAVGYYVPTWQKFFNGTASTTYGFKCDPQNIGNVNFCYYTTAQSHLGNTIFGGTTFQTPATTIDVRGTGNFTSNVTVGGTLTVTSTITGKGNLFLAGNASVTGTLKVVATSTLATTTINGQLPCLADGTNCQSNANGTAYQFAQFTDNHTVTGVPNFFQDFGFTNHFIIGTSTRSVENNAEVNISGEYDQGAFGAPEKVTSYTGNVVMNADDLIGHGFLSNYNARALVDTGGTGHDFTLDSFEGTDSNVIILSGYASTTVGRFTADRAHVGTNAGHINTAYGVQADLGLTGGSVGTWAAFYAPPINRSAGNASDTYAALLEPPGFGDNQWTLAVDGGNSYVKDKLKVGSSAIPNANLDVDGNQNILYFDTTGQPDGPAALNVASEASALTDSANSFIAFSAQTENQTGGGINYSGGILGVDGEGRNRTGNVANFVGGVYGSAHFSDHSTTTGAFGVIGDLGISSNAVATEADAFKTFDADASGATVDTLAGINIGQFTGATHNWGVYDRSAFNAFLGSTSFGTSTQPIATAYVDGTLNVTATSTLANTTISNVTIQNGGSSGHAMCWKTNTTLGYCSTIPDVSGNCTCN